MKYIAKYKSMGITNKEEAFKYLLTTLKDTIRSYDFFVAWEKVLDNVSKTEVALNILNTLIGKKNIKENLKILIKKYPEIVPVIPLLIAVRGSTIEIADIGGDIKYSFSEKKFYTDEQIEKIILFSEKSGLLKIIADKSIKNLVDYAIGVEVGLDTNARKNRSGTVMENLTEVYIKAICEKHGFEYLTQATANKVMQEFGKAITTDEANRQFDFVINARKMIYLVETNYYSGGGSKLKSVAGEFSNLFNLVKDDTTNFIWVTDGKGWLSAKRPLCETFTAIDYIMNIRMIEHGLLEDIITKGL